MNEMNKNLLIAFLLGALVVSMAWHLSGNLSGITIDSEDTSGNIFQVASSTGDNYFTVTADGKIGIRNQAPTTALDVYGVIRVYDDVSYECTLAIEGAIHYRGQDKRFWGCNGTSWQRLDSAL